jgi:hypothetical protein
MEPIRTRLLLFRPSDGKVGCARDLAVDDGTVGHRGTDECPAVGTQEVEERRKAGARQHDARAGFDRPTRVRQ